MKPVIPLVRIKHGPHLYGTSTPTSDQDFKGVHLPSGEAIILGRAENHIKRDVISKENGKNTADAIDESFSVQKFFEMLMKGDTVATEILFAEPEWQHPYWRHVQIFGKALLNRQCKGFVGYCVRQAAKYGIKGSRMAAVRAVLDILEDECQSGGHALKLETGSVWARLEELAQRHEHVLFENIPNPDGSDNLHLVCYDRKMSQNVTVNAAWGVYHRVWENYGQRARDAMNNEGIDWKAMSHAVRVAGQAIELLDTGKITFPRPNARWLLDIKLGLIPYKVVSEQLEQLVAEVHAASERSQLPETSDHKLADRVVRDLYLEQVNV